MKTAEITKILMPVDFSPISLHALAYAEELAHRCRAQLLLFYVIEPVVAPMEFNTAAIIEANHTEQIIDKLQQLRDLVVRHGVDALTLAGEGEPATIIINTVADKGCNLIVMGTHGHQGFRKLLLGSKTERVVRGAGCPVLTVGPHGLSP